MVSCDRVVEGISAHVDGEDPGIDEDELAEHVARCASCRAFAQRAPELARRLRLRPAERHVVDRTSEILAAVDRDDRAAGSPPRRGAPAARWALAGLALVQLALAAPALVLGDGGASVHAAREVAAFEIALAVGFLVAVLRPAHAASLLPVVVTVAAMLAVATVIDFGGRLTAIQELGHVGQMVGVGLLWAVARGRGGSTRSRLRPT